MISERRANSFQRSLTAKLEKNKNADDPLFRPVDGDDFRVNGDSASDFSNLVENGLVRVTMPLPATVTLRVSSKDLEGPPEGVRRVPFLQSITRPAAGWNQAA